MNTFRYKGRGPDGQPVAGQIVAESKDDAVNRLRAQHVMVTEVTPSSSTVDSAPDISEIAESNVTRSHSNTLAESRTKRPRRLRGLLIAAAFAAAAVGVGYMAPIVAFECERKGEATVDCAIKERALGVITLREQRLADVISVELESRTWTETNGEQRGESRLVFLDLRRTSIRPTAWDHSDSTPSMRETASRFLADVAQAKVLSNTPPERASGWAGQWIPLLISGLLLLLAALMLVVRGLSLFARPTDWVYGSVGKLAKRADERGPDDWFRDE